MFQLVPRQWTGSFGGGFMFFAVLAIAVLLALRRVQRGWVGACIGPNGRVITPASAGAAAFPPHPVLPALQAGVPERWRIGDRAGAGV